MPPLHFVTNGDYPAGPQLDAIVCNDPWCLHTDHCCWYYSATWLHTVAPGVFSTPANNVVIISTSHQRLWLVLFLYVNSVARQWWFLKSCVATASVSSVRNDYMDLLMPLSFIQDLKDYNPSIHVVIIEIQLLLQRIICFFYDWIHELKLFEYVIICNLLY